MKVVINNNENSYITVNSSRYGVPIYEKLGFVKTEEEKEQDGLKFTEAYSKKLSKSVISQARRINLSVSNFTLLISISTFIIFLQI